MNLLELINLYIENYKKFKKLYLDFSNKDLQEQGVIQYFFPNINFQVLIGLNGSGKTTVLSFLCMIFRYLERHQDRIPCDFEIVYRLKTNIITITKKEENILITVNESSPKLLLEYNVSKKKHLRKPSQRCLDIEDTTIIDILEYLPNKCIAISVDIDYPKNYGTNLIRNINLYTMIDVKHFQDVGITGKNVSYGVLSFINKSHADGFMLLKQMGITFSGYIQVYFNSNSRYSNDDTAHIELSDLLQNENDKDIILEQIFSTSYFANFIRPISDETIGIGFNVINFLECSKHGYSILDILIKHNLIYINDIYFEKDDCFYGFKNMSTGEKSLLGSLLFILNYLEEDLLVIIEEPELHLNDIWISRLIDLYTLYFSGYEAQFIISSHRYALINKLFKSQLLLCENRITKPKFNTFMAASDSIINHLDSFRGQCGSNMDKIQQLINSNNLQMMQQLVNCMGESFEQYTLFLHLKEIGALNVESQ